MYKTITIGTLFQKDNIETLGKLKSLRVVGTLREGKVGVISASRTQ